MVLLKGLKMAANSEVDQTRSMPHMDQNHSLETPAICSGDESHLHTLLLNINQTCQAGSDTRGN